MEKKKDGKTLIFILVGVIGLCLITIGLTYAYWILTKQQTGENVVNTACLNITFTGENDITLDKAYPMNEEQLESFLSSATPYHFTIHNECDDLASASINLESLNVVGKALEDEYIDAILYEDDYNSNLNTNKKLTRDILNDDNKVIKDAKHAYSLYNFTLKANEEKDFNLLLYMDSETPMEEDNMNASWKGKITLSTEYQEEDTTIRKISSYGSDNNGMWGYKDKLTQIVIENKKSVKIAEDGGKVYGPFDESADGYGGVQSYVVCDNEETSCTGYLQGTNGIKGNEDSSNLFSYFKNVTSIDGLENLDTIKVTNMSNMFGGCSKIIMLDISSFDTRNLINSNNMFGGMSSLQNLNLSNFVFPENHEGMFNVTSLETLDLTNVNTSKMTSMDVLFVNLEKVKTLDLSSFDTSHVTSMQAMFMNCSNLQKLDLSSFDTSQVINMNAMFMGTTSLQSITFSSTFVHKPEATTSDMFSNCGAPERPTGDTWSGISFD